MTRILWQIYCGVNSEKIKLCTVLYCKLWTQAIASQSTSKLSQFFSTRSTVIRIMNEYRLARFMANGEHWNEAMV